MTLCARCTKFYHRASLTLVGKKLVCPLCIAAQHAKELAKRGVA